MPKRPSKAMDVKQIPLEERRLAAFKLRQAGQDYRTIAAALGISRQTAFCDVRKCLQEIREDHKEEREELVGIEVERLDRMLAVAMKTALAGDLGAMDRVLKIGQQRCDLLGLWAEKEKPDESKEQPLQVVVNLSGTSKAG